MSTTIVLEQLSFSRVLSVQGGGHRESSSGEGSFEAPLNLAPNFLTRIARRLQADVECSEREACSTPKESHHHRRHQRTIFHGSKHTPIPVRDYVQRIAEHSKCSHVCFIASYGYLQRLSKVDRKYRLCSRSVHRLLIASVLIAAKLLEDKFYSNAFYARIGGISTKEINKLELEILHLLDFRVFVSHSDLRTCLADLSSDPPCKPLPPVGSVEAVGRKRVNEDPSNETATPAKLQHSTGKGHILVTPQEPEAPAGPRSASAGSARPLSRGSSGCGSWEGGPAASVAVLRTVLDVGGSEACADTLLRGLQSYPPRHPMMLEVTGTAH